MMSLIKGMSKTDVSESREDRHIVVFMRMLFKYTAPTATLYGMSLNLSVTIVNDTV